MRPKHVPIRTCVACRTADAKRTLLRVVRLPDGTVGYDAKGKAAGRGAYVCAQPSCIALARKQRKLERSLNSGPIDGAVFDELERAAARSGEQDTQAAAPPPDFGSAALVDDLQEAAGAAGALDLASAAGSDTNSGDTP